MLRRQIFKRQRVALVAAAAASLVGGYVNWAQGTTFEASWGNFASGNYGLASNWTNAGGAIPNDNVGANQYFNVTINRLGGATVTGNMNAEVMNLTMGAANVLNLNATTVLDLVGSATAGPVSVSNAGTIALLSSGGNGAELLFAGSSTNISGAGTITMTADSVIRGAGTLTTSNYIGGSGGFGLNSMAVINNGTVSADASAQTLFVDPRASGGFVNNNVLRAMPNATLSLSGNGGGSFTNNGTISATGFVLQAGIVDLVAGATISGGTLSSDAFSRFQVRSGDTATLVTLTNNANVQVHGGATLTLSGTITNNNAIRTAGTSGTSTINLGSGTVTVSGAGSVVLGSGAISGRIVGTGTFDNNSTIAGFGRIGGPQLWTNNAGTINANALDQALEIEGFNFRNTGTMQASAGDLRIVGTAINNTNGRIDLLGGDLRFANGVQFNEIGSGLMNVGANSFVEIGAGLAAPVKFQALGLSINQNGNIRTQNGGDLEMVDTNVSNAGQLILLGNTVATETSLLINNGTTTFSGSGSIGINESAGSASIIGVGTLNNLGNLITGDGRVGDGTLGIINDGVISASTTAKRLIITPKSGVGLINTGELNSTNNATLELNAGTYLNTGGMIRGITGGVRMLDGVYVSGGSVTTGASGKIEIMPGTTTFQDVSNFSFVQLKVGSTMRIVNSYTDTQTMMEDAPGTSTITLAGGTTTINANGLGGTLHLGSASGGVTNINGTGTLVNAAPHNITGVGNIGLNTISIVNSGTINADGAVGTQIVIDPSSAGLFNTGTIQTSVGARITLLGSGGGVFNNNGGTIAAMGNQVIVDNAAIIGGTLNSRAGSEVELFGSGTLANVTNLGTLRFMGLSDIKVSGTINNVGSINIDGGASPGQFSLATGTITLSGGGTVSMAGGPQFARLQGSGTFVNLDNTIKNTLDSAILGNNTLSIRNFGTISAESPTGTFFIDPGAGIWTNAGTMQAQSGGILELIGTGGGALLGNTGGRIIANNNSSVRLNQVTINGGTLVTSGTGTISLAASSTSTIGFLTNTGRVVVQGGQTLQLDGALTNSGTLSADATSGQATLHMLPASTLTNSGTILLPSTGTAWGQLVGSGVLNNSGLIRGGGVLDADLGASTLTINNSGAIESDGEGMSIGSFGSLPVIINNSGVVRVRASTNNTELNPTVTVSGSGSIDVMSGGALLSFATITTPAVALNGAMAQSGNPASLGNVDGAGTLLVGISFIGGPVPGNVTVNHLRGLSVLNVNAGTLTTTAGGGTLGTSVVAGTLTIGSLGPARWDLTDNDLIFDYSGSSALPTIQNYIATARNGGAWNGNGLTSAAAKDHPQHVTTLGTIEASDYILANGTNTFSGQTVDNTTVLVKYTYYGDTELNGKVDGADYARTDTTFNNEASQGNIGGWFNGDFDYNGKVDGADYAMIDSAFNAQSGSLRPMLSFLDGSDPNRSHLNTPALRTMLRHYDMFGESYAYTVLANVPEPGSAGILGLVSLPLCKRVRRRPPASNCGHIKTPTDSVQEKVTAT